MASPRSPACPWPRSSCSPASRPTRSARRRWTAPRTSSPTPRPGKVYLALTNNTNRGRPGFAGPDEANPRTPNREGHVLELTETGNDAAATTFAWNLLLVCGLPESAGTYFGGYDGPVSPISCPDNVAFDDAGDLWISTDGQPGTIGLDDALHRVTLTGAERGRVEQFLAVPREAETCGPVIDSQDGMVYVAVQHPGEDGLVGRPALVLPGLPPAGHPRGRRLGRPAPQRHPGVPRLTDTAPRHLRHPGSPLDRLPGWLTRRAWSRPGAWRAALDAARDEGFTFFDWLSAVDRGYDEAAPGVDVVAHLLDVGTPGALRGILLVDPGRRR